MEVIPTSQLLDTDRSIETMLTLDLLTEEEKMELIKNLNDI